MEIKRVALSDLHPYPNNPRRNNQSVDAVAESIKQCGYCSPIVVDEDYMILAGHTRYKALQKLGWDECEVCVVPGLTEKQKKAYIISDNKTSELSDWDYKLLSDELFSLSDDYDWEKMGFNSTELISLGCADINMDLWQFREKNKKHNKTIVCPKCGSEFTY